ncbi:23530_t:CDS:2, partial [Entrophospora sp. SA101]
MSHLGQIKIPADFKDIYSFIDDIGLLLGIKDIFTRSFNNFYEKLRVPSQLEIKPTLKKKTLSTEEFEKLVSKTREKAYLLVISVVIEQAHLAKSSTRETNLKDKGLISAD